MADEYSYFDLKSIQFGLRWIQEIRALRKGGLPVPALDWDVVYVFSGPEITLEEGPHDTKLGYNQNKNRLLAGFDIAREVTALRLGIETNTISFSDIQKHGPKVYFDGWPHQNESFKDLKKKGTLSRDFGFPDDSLIVGSPVEIVNTGDQVRNLLVNEWQDARKIIFVSDLYHLPRTKRYFGTEGTPRISPERCIFSFPRNSKVSVKIALGEIRRFRLYVLKGFITENTLWD